MIFHMRTKRILSFHPIFEGDKNIICAGRDPGPEDIEAIRAADAVILPQGCKASLYHAARENCSQVFPDYDARFRYPGKIGQSRLFQETDTPHPRTETYLSLEEFENKAKNQGFPDFGFPFVFKFDWGGEGDNVFLLTSLQEFQAILEKAAAFERSGQSGFLLQEHVPEQDKTLRVVVIGEKIVSYWRVQENTGTFQANLAKGAVIDRDSDPDLQTAAITSAKPFCEKTGINLAGFDFLFSRDPETDIITPLFLEINYFFGRQGLGGSEKFYEQLNTEIKKWIDKL